MFGLPLETFAYLALIPAAWLAYTIGFLVISRDWKDEEQ